MVLKKQIQYIGQHIILALGRAYVHTMHFDRL